MKLKQNVNILPLLALLPLFLTLNCSSSPTDEETNHPPNTPTELSPGLEANNISIDATLSWVCTDPDGDDLTYDIYFGTDAEPPLVSDNQSGCTYDPGTLEYDTRYYWNIRAFDPDGDSAKVSLYFNTEDEPLGGEGIFAALVVGRQVLSLVEDAYYIDQREEN